MEPVGVGKRAVAVLIDSILLFIVGYAIAAAVGQTTQAGFNITGAPFFLWLGVSLGYYIVMEATSGATLGKKVMGLKVVKTDGSALDWQAALVRNVLRLIDGFFFYLVGAIVVWVSKRRQRLGDMAANTLVVSTKAAAALLLVLCVGALDATPAFAGMPRLTDPVISDARGGAVKTSFKPQTAKIFLHVGVADVPGGSKVRADWIAVRTKVAPANYRIDSVELNAGPLITSADFNMSKPNAGWPEGDYRVDLFINGKPASHVDFRIAK